MRTRVYIDGYNLYYGCLKGTSLKWLNLCTLFEKFILPSSTSIAIEAEPLFIKYFTAMIIEQAASAADSLMSQEQYHAALRKHSPGALEIIKGYYDMKTVRARQVDPVDPKKWLRDCNDVDVWKLEEKQTDVNIAVHLLKDVLCEKIEHVVLVTNDTDLAPALAMIRQVSDAKIGLVIPTKNHERPANQDLVDHAHWTRTHITLDELKSSQFPRVVTLDKKSASKPLSWYANSDILEKILDLGVTEKGGKAAVYKWLEQPNRYFANRTGIEMIESGDGAVLLNFMEEWHKKKAASSN